MTIYAEIERLQRDYRAADARHDWPAINLIGGQIRAAEDAELERDPKSAADAANKLRMAAGYASLPLTDKLKRLARDIEHRGPQPRYVQRAAMLLSVKDEGDIGAAEQIVPRLESVLRWLRKAMGSDDGQARKCAFVWQVSRPLCVQHGLSCFCLSGALGSLSPSTDDVPLRSGLFPHRADLSATARYATATPWRPRRRDVEPLPKRLDKSSTAA
jgi:hypothetical protein